MDRNNRVLTWRYKAGKAATRRELRCSDEARMMEAKKTLGLTREAVETAMAAYKGTVEKVPFGKPIQLDRVLKTGSRRGRPRKNAIPSKGLENHEYVKW